MWKRVTKNEAIIANTKNAIDKPIVMYLIHTSIPRSFLLEKSSDFSPVKALLASSSDFCSTIMPIKRTDTTNNKISITPISPPLKLLIS